MEDDRQRDAASQPQVRSDTGSRTILAIALHRGRNAISETIGNWQIERLQWLQHKKARLAGPIALRIYRVFDA